MTITECKSWNYESFLRVDDVTTFISNAKIDKEVNNKLAKASRAFDRLYKCECYDEHLEKGTKINAYWAIIFGWESWNTNQQYLRYLERFHQRCFLTILPIRIGLQNTPTASLQWSKTVPLRMSLYDTEQSDGEAPVMLQLWGMQNTPSFPSLPGLLWPGIVAPGRILSMDQIELFDI